MKNKIEKKFYENGNVFKEYEVNSKGEIDGYFKIFHENGELKAKVNFTNNVQDDGEVISYHPDGSRARKVLRINGEINGDFFEWYQNGKLKTQGHYKNDVFRINKKFDENGVEMEIHLDHDIAEGDIIEILNFLETNLDCEIRFKSYFTDHYYQLKEDNQYDENGPFTINEDGSLLYSPNNKGLNISTKEQKSAIQAGQNYPEGYTITCDHGEVNLKKPFYWGDCYIWATGILKNEDLINKIKEFFEEYEDMEEEEIREQGWYLFVDEFLELGSFVEEHLGNLESEGLKVYKKKQGFGTSFGLDNISWCVMDKTEQTEISWLVKKQ